MSIFVCLAAEDIPENGAYAKLQGRDLDSGDFFEAYVTELPTILGRAHKGQPSKGFVSLGGCKQISKFHAKIDFEYKKSYFFIEPTGKNSITVRKVQHQCDPNYIKSNSKKQPEEKTSKVTSNDGDKSTEKHGDSSNAGLDNSHVESKEPKETKEPDSKADAEEVKRGKGSGAPVNGKGPRATGKRIKINSKDPIRIGNIGFYFLKSLK